MDYYKILNIPCNSSESEIKRAYKTMAKKWHPDRNQNNIQESERKFKEISNAYDMLINKSSRVEDYDYGTDIGYQYKNQTQNYHSFFQNAFPTSSVPNVDDIFSDNINVFENIDSNLFQKFQSQPRNNFYSCNIEIRNGQKLMTETKMDNFGNEYIVTSITKINT